MIFPVVVNVNVLYEVNGRKFATVNRAVLDLHYKYILKIINAGKGNVIIEHADGANYDLQINFEEMYNLYNMQHPIHEEFKKEVDLYAKDNLNNLIGKSFNDGEDKEPA